MCHGLDGAAGDRAPALGAQRRYLRRTGPELFDAIKNRMTPLDNSHGWGYQPPEHWQIWYDSLVSAGDLPGDMKLEDAYTNQFVETWNEGQ